MATDSNEIIKGFEKVKDISEVSQQDPKILVEKARDDLNTYQSLRDTGRNFDAIDEAATAISKNMRSQHYREEIFKSDAESAKRIELIAAQLKKQKEQTDLTPERTTDSERASPSTKSNFNAREDQEDKKVVIPETILNRYLHADNKFYFRDQDSKVAFEDKGTKLHTKYSSPDVAISMVQLAEAKEWSSITVKGTDEFKREVWMEGSLRGIDVQGYKARDVDIAKLEELKKDREGSKVNNSIEKGPEKQRFIEPEKDTTDKRVVNEQRSNLTEQQSVALKTLETILRDRGDSEKAIKLASDIQLERFNSNRVYVGKVIAHGEAPYEHNKDNESSYFVKIKTTKGEQEIWGKDLPRALNESNVDVGDQVALAYKGSKPVSVPVPVKDSSGNVTGVKDVETIRNTWEITPVEKIREEVREQLERASIAKTNPVVMMYDSKAPAYSGSRVSQHDRQQPEAERTR